MTHDDLGGAIVTRRIEGVITSTAMGGGVDLIIFLRPWREVGGELQRRELRVVVPMKTERSADRAMSTWHGKAARLAVTTLRYPSAKLRWGLAIGEPPLRRIDAEPLTTQGKAKERARPVIDDPVLGRLELDRQQGCYLSERRIGRRRYELVIEVTDPDDVRAVSAVVRRARAKVTRTESDLPTVRDAVAAELLETCNERWRSGGRPITPAGFVRRQVVSSIAVGAGRVTVWFECGGLFADHGVEVRLSSRGKIQEILIA